MDDDPGTAAPDPALPARRPRAARKPRQKAAPVTVRQDDQSLRDGTQDPVMHAGQQVGWTAHAPAGWYACTCEDSGTLATWISRPQRTKAEATAALVEHLHG